MTQVAEKTIPYIVRQWREESTDSETGKVWPALFAIYDQESGVRLKYADNEAQAIRLVTRWNTGNVPAEIERKAHAARHLRELLKPGDTVQTILRHVSRSGMMRHISAVFNSQDITYYVAALMDDKVADDGGIKCGGCGMDMGFNLVYNLSRTLFPEGFICAGEECRSNDHFNEPDKYNRKRFAGKMHKGDGGYALRQAWL